MSSLLLILPGFMLLRYETGHSSVLAGFALGGSCIISCADFECELAIIDVESAEILATETFEGLQEGRNKAGYTVGPGGRKVWSCKGCCQSSGTLTRCRMDFSSCASSTGYH